MILDDSAADPRSDLMKNLWQTEVVDEVFSRIDKLQPTASGSGAKWTSPRCWRIAPPGSISLADGSSGRAP
jgi:hypothetical protein